MGLGIRPRSGGKHRGDSSRTRWRCRSYLSGAGRRSCSLAVPQPARDARSRRGHSSTEIPVRGVAAAHAYTYFRLRPDGPGAVAMLGVA